MGLGPRQKALAINLDSKIYGTFAEIGAGQEVARHFFQAGGAAGTVAKSMSAYDMTMSDAIYGKESSGRYVSEERLQKMLDIEYEVLVSRLEEIRSKDTTYFAFADTVAAKSFKGTGVNHGWIGVKFQHEAGARPSQVIMHVQMLDVENIQQQEALGMIGVNLIYAAFYLRKEREAFVLSLMEGLTAFRIHIDMIRVSGDGFLGVDSRLLSLELVKLKLCSAVIFDERGMVLQASDVLYKKNVLVARGAYRPPTLLSLDMLEKGLLEFQNILEVSEKQNVIVLPEISMSLLLDRGKVDNEDFLARVDLLAALGLRVLISSCESYAELGHFLKNHSKKKVGFVVATYTLEEIFNKSRYEDKNWGFMESIGKLFGPETSLLVYPGKEDEKSEIQTASSLKIKSTEKALYDFLVQNHSIIEVRNYNSQVISIWSRKVLKMIQNGEAGWESLVPESVAKTVKQKCLFGAKCENA